VWPFMNEGGYNPQGRIVHSTWATDCGISFVWSDLSERAYGSFHVRFVSNSEILVTYPAQPYLLFSQQGQPIPQHNMTGSWHPDGCHKNEYWWYKEDASLVSVAKYRRTAQVFGNATPAWYGLAQQAISQYQQLRSNETGTNGKEESNQNSFMFTTLGIIGLTVVCVMFVITLTIIRRQMRQHSVRQRASNQEFKSPTQSPCVTKLDAFCVPSSMIPSIHSLVRSAEREHWLIGAEDIQGNELIKKDVYRKLSKGTLFSSLPVSIFQTSFCTDTVADTLAEDVLSMRRARHSNIVLFMGMSVTSEKSCFSVITESIAGPNIAEYMAGSGACTNGSTSLFMGIAMAMNYLHSLDPPIVHHYLNPGYVVIENRGLHADAKVLMPFNASIAEVVSDPQAVMYMAPEDRKGLKGLPSADVYSYGMLFLQLCAGYPPGETAEDTRGHFAIESGLLRKCINEDPSLRPNFRVLLQCQE